MLHEVIDEMANDKSLGLNGFLVSFTKSPGTLWGQVHLEAIKTRSLRDFINRGNIKFIPKLRNPKLITSWRHGGMETLFDQGTIKFIPKPSNPKLITSWRHVTLLNVS